MGAAGPSHGVLIALGSIFWLAAAGVRHFMARSVLARGVFWTTDMTGLWLYAYVVMPLVVIAMGYAAVRLTEPKHPPHAGPAE